MKDLSSRCLIDLSNTEKNDRRIFYFKPDSVLLKDMDTQDRYRQNLIRNISQPPKVREQASLAEQLNQEVTEAIMDRTEPDDVRVYLANFFQRRSYNLQHRKYKMLLRWAHFALTSEYLERIGHHGTITFGRIQYQLENAIKRHERLSQDDDYGSLRDGNIQKPKAKGSKDEEGEFQNGLYTESKSKDPLSCLRMDDFEIYLRARTYELKLYRTTEKFVTRLKWLPLAKNVDILKESHILLKQNKVEFFEQCKKAEALVRKRFDDSKMQKTDDVIIKMEEILASTFPCNFKTKDNFNLHAPIRVNNLIELHANILQRAEVFNINGDIEIDDGHSFTYQVHVFFTLYFQKQIIKSQFSLYDQTARDMKNAYESNELPDEEMGDINEIERRNLNSLLLIDFQMVDLMNTNSDQSNLFLLKKGKKVIDQMQELKKNFKNITVVRLKKAYWLDCVMLRPKIDEWTKQQDAFFTYDCSPDLLLQSTLDLIDVNDISTVNTVYTEISQMQSILQSSPLSDQKHIIEQLNQVVDKSMVTQLEAKKLVKLFGGALKLNLENTESQQSKQSFMTSSLSMLPQHYLQSLHILRHMKIRDVKTKLLYTLNFFRAVQKRLALDLRQFAGQEIISQQVDSKAPQEATYIGKNTNMISNNLFEGVSMKKQQEGSQEQDEQEDQGESLIDIMKWKYKNQFNAQMLSTCPVMHSFNSKHGEALDDKDLQPDMTDSKSIHKVNINKKCTEMLTRMDNFKVNEETQEIFVIDDYGMHVMFDCALDDQVNIDTQLLKIGTFFIRKNEIEFDIQTKIFEMTDRFQLIEDLYNWEFAFQYSKSKLVMIYLEVFEHICDPLEQQRMMQVITDLMAQRPRIDHQKSSYFVESYKAEVNCMETHIKLVREIIDYQMSLEKKENKHIKDYLQMTYRLANDYQNKKWTDVSQDQIQKEVKQRQVAQGGLRFQDIQQMQDQLKMEKDQASGNAGINSIGGADNFADMLGLQEMSVESMVHNTKSDEMVDDMMNQDANFIKTQEGYPTFLKEGQQDRHGRDYNQSGQQDSLSRVKFTHLSHEIGVLDFYESLTVIPKVCAAITQTFDQVQSECKPSSSLHLIAIQTVYFEKCYVDFKKCSLFTSDDLIEYSGSQYIENDLIMSSPDKLMFLVKDMIAHISSVYKKNLNPFFISKLDLFTVNNFQFPEITKHQMLSQKLQRLDVNFTKNFIETQLQSSGSHARFFPKLREDDRKVNAPPMLLVFCNLIEVIRLRENLIINVTETMVLQDIYNNLKELANRNNLRLLAQTSIQFQHCNGFTRDDINYFDDGSLTDVEIDLAVNEFDPTFRSNLNFMNSESVQCLVLDNGVAELRAALHYQIMHKQILLVAAQANSRLMVSHRRAVVELELLQDHRIQVEGPIINYSALYSPSQFGNNELVLNDEWIQSLKNRVMVQTAQQCEEAFMPVINIKEFLRGRIEKKQKEVLAMLQSFTFQKPESKDPKQAWPLLATSVARMDRDYRMSLLHCYCTQVIKLNLANAMRISAIEQSVQLKSQMNLFPKDLSLFELQSNEFKDLFPQHSHFKSDNLEDSLLFSNQEEGDLNSLTTLASTKTLLMLDSLTFTDKAVFEKSIFDQVENLEFDMTPLLKSHYDQVNLKQKQRLLIQSLCQYTQNSTIQSLVNTVPGRVYQFYKSLVKIFDIHFFFAKMNIRPLECMQLINTTSANEAFWDDSTEQSELLLVAMTDDKKLSEIILKKMIDSKRKKQHLHEELTELVHKMKNVIKSAATEAGPTLSIVKVNQYLAQYQETIEYKLLSGIFTLLENFYTKQKGSSQISVVLNCISELTNYELDAPIFLNNACILNQSILSQNQRSLSELVKQDYCTFNKTVQGLKSEKELIDPMLLMIERLFQDPILSQKGTSYVGQSCLFKAAGSLQTLVMTVGIEELRYLGSIFTQLDSNSKDIRDVAAALQHRKNVTETDILMKEQIYFQELASSKVIYFMLLMLSARETLTSDSHRFEAVYLQPYQREIGWKVESEFQKKNSQILQKAKKDQKGPQTRTTNHSDFKVLKEAISQVEDAIQMYSRNREKELQAQQVKLIKVMAKSLIKISRREIEMRLLRMAYDAISKEVGAMSKCLEMASRNVERNINNWQQFAPTLSDYQVSKQNHLDPLNRIGMMQSWLTRMKNRGVDIETLTSGPGIVFTYKDLNECLQTFCTQLLGYAEKEMRSRTHTLHSMIGHLQTLIYVKDSRVDGLKQKIHMMNDNITRIVNSKVYEKGNGLIFELDRGMREVRFYKDHINGLESEMKEYTRAEYRKALNEKDQVIDACKKQAFDTMNQLVIEFKALSTKQEIDNVEKIRIAKEKCIFDVGSTKPSVTFSSDKKDTYGGKQALLKSQEDVIRLHKLIKQQRTLWMLKFQSQKVKADDDMQILKDKLTSNKALWGQLQDSDKRTQILQQELMFTQKSLSQCEKIIEKLKEELKLSEQERMRLFQFKENKGQRLIELEEQVKKIDISEHVNINKIISEIRSKDKEIVQLKKVENNFNSRLSQVKEISSKSDVQWQKKYGCELELKNQAMQKLGDLQDEIKYHERGKQLELRQPEISKNNIDWRIKCKELFDICKGLVLENSDLTSKAKHIQSSEISAHIQDSKRSDNVVTTDQEVKEKQNPYKSHGKTRNSKLRIDSNTAQDPNSHQQSQVNVSELSNMFLQSTTYSNNFLLPSIKRKQRKLQLLEAQNQDQVNHIKNKDSGLSNVETSQDLSGLIHVNEEDYTDKNLIVPNKSDYSDSYSYGGGSTINNETSIISNIVLPIKPIFPVSNVDSNNIRGMSTQPSRGKLKQYNSRASIGKSTSHNDLIPVTQTQLSGAYTNHQIDQRHVNYRSEIQNSNNSATKTMNFNNASSMRVLGSTSVKKVDAMSLNKDLTSTFYKRDLSVKQGNAIENMMALPYQSNADQNMLRLKGNKLQRKL